MFSLKLLQILLFVALSASACRFWQSPTVATPAPTPAAVKEIASEIPFNTKEPEVFQTEIVVTANGVEERIFTARNGANRVTIYDYQKKSEFALLQIDGGASFVISYNQKVYAENLTGGEPEIDENFSITELLGNKRAAKFESLGAENPENNAAKYLVRFDDSAKSETIITIDPNIDLPVRQEFYSVAGEQKTLVSTTELKNFNRQIDTGNFELPKDYKKVSPIEFQEILRRERKQ